jgi:hypothetical protein
VVILRDGRLLGGGPYFWSTGSYTCDDGWKLGRIAALVPLMFIVPGGLAPGPSGQQTRQQIAFYGVRRCGF